MTPYLKESSVFDKEDFVDNLLESFTYDGILTAIPPRFFISTVVGKTSKVGVEMGWTLQEMMELVEKNPDSQLFANVNQVGFLADCLTYNLDVFVDWSIGECYFDSEEFRTLLEFASIFPGDDEIDWAVSGRAQAEKKQADEILLERTRLISDFGDIQIYSEIYGEEVTFIGYPTMDGSVGCLMEVPECLYGITARSKNKDGAWEFIESYLADSLNDPYPAIGFPVTKDKLQERIDSTYVLDENGERVLDENGEPLRLTSYNAMFEDWEYFGRAPTEEEIDRTLELISVARVHNNTNRAGMAIKIIIYEEAEAYFSGQKSLDKVVDTIQNRAQLYVSENS